MIFESFFKKKKKQVEKVIDDAADVFRPEQHDNELEKIDEDFTAEKENLGNVKKQSFDAESSISIETEQEHRKRPRDGKLGDTKPNVVEVDLNVNSDNEVKLQSTTRRDLDKSKRLGRRSKVKGEVPIKPEELESIIKEILEELNKKSTASSIVKGASSK